MQFLILYFFDFALIWGFWKRNRHIVRDLYTWELFAWWSNLFKLIIFWAYKEVLATFTARL